MIDSLGIGFLDFKIHTHDCHCIETFYGRHSNFEERQVRVLKLTLPEFLA